MATYNAENERTKRRYLMFLKDARRHGEASLDKAAAAIHRFEIYTRFRDFRSFRIEQATAFKRHLAEQVNAQTRQPLSKATLYSTLMALRNFFQWLAGQPGYRSRMSYADAEYFNLSEADTRIAKASIDREGPTLEQILHVIGSMPHSTEIEKRDRAVLAFALLSGARDDAIASMKLKHVDLDAGRVDQDARDVRTKFRKTFQTWFFPVGEQPLLIVKEWIAFLVESRLWGPEDPLFPATKIGQDEDRHFCAEGLSRRGWADAGPIRDIFRRAFPAAGIPYYHPHSLRKTLAQLGERLCRTPEEFKAWSQNLGHEKVMTTFSSYGTVAPRRQGEIMTGISSTDRGVPAMSADDLAQLNELVQKIAGRTPPRE